MALMVCRSGYGGRRRPEQGGRRQLGRGGTSAAAVVIRDSEAAVNGDLWLRLDAQRSAPRGYRVTVLIFCKPMSTRTSIGILGGDLGARKAASFVAHSIVEHSPSGCWRIPLVVLRIAGDGHTTCLSLSNCSTPGIQHDRASRTGTVPWGDVRRPRVTCGRAEVALRKQRARSEPRWRSCASR
jgi:hypothetical protein